MKINWGMLAILYHVTRWFVSSLRVYKRVGHWEGNLSEFISKEWDRVQAEIGQGCPGNVKCRKKTVLFLDECSYPSTPQVLLPTNCMLQDVKTLALPDVKNNCSQNPLPLSIQAWASRSWNPGSFEPLKSKISRDSSFSLLRHLVGPTFFRCKSVSGDAF